jgi:hypothetical protein
LQRLPSLCISVRIYKIFPKRKPGTRFFAFFGRSVGNRARSFPKPKATRLDGQSPQVLDMVNIYVYS